MRKDSLLVLLLLGLLSAVGQPAIARPVTIDFHFHDETNDIDVRGYVLGLEDNGNGQAATSVVVTSNSGGYGIGEYIGNPSINTWYVSNGNVYYVDFISSGMLNTPPAQTCCSLGLVDFFGTGTSYTIGGLRNDPSTPEHIDGRSSVTFTERGPNLPVPVLPFPALALLALSLTAVGVYRRRRLLKQ
jgi:hypothetical protein